MTSTVTDTQIRDLAATANPASIVILRWTAERHQDGAAATELEHQRRMVALRADGVIAVLCPVVDDSEAGMAGVLIMSIGADEAKALIAEDPCVQAGMMTFEAHTCLTFPGDPVPVHDHRKIRG
ncbi:MAG: hypothetical protein HOU81_08970 [Hamadaea sp.]|uniref:hypothetical protein n=1 Tax=Hamadaea sp. TaxID=2024425 RepID=UPI00183739F2|nr:hypothetical protein [Hamadaea sp.]NUR70939.1 hypothetical protein [Hamadaea sp.]NUT21726.1 hypothetical protein [Hamadaea sp.]